MATSRTNTRCATPARRRAWRVHRHTTLRIHLIPMTTTPATSFADLKRIAHDAMIQYQLLPDFSPEVLAETAQLVQAASASDPAIRDMRTLLWASIDNDDSLDLDH